MGKCVSHEAGPAELTAQAYKGEPLRILALHGGNMSEKSFKPMIKQLQTATGSLCDFIYAQAPHEVENNKTCYLWMEKGEEESERTWKTSLEYLKHFIAAHGPFDGVLGYSMGSAVVSSLLAALPEGTFRFAILCAGYLPTTTPTIMATMVERKPIMTPSLHIHGEKDFIPQELQLDQMDYFDENSRQRCAHPGGHDLPRDDQHQEEVVAFLVQFALDS